jgi:hypothetical protein
LIDCKDPSREFSQLLAAAEGSTVSVPKSNQEVLRSFCPALGNSELFGAIFHAFGDELSVENVISRLSFLFDAESDCELEHEFASAHF